ncbi:MAG: hypothetical protein ACJAS6_000092 [Rickettsiales bacterium]|jgi:hypothetical protein
MDIVYDAISTFVAQNKRLPCPASLELAKGHANYGLELGGNQSTIATACAGTFSINSAIVHKNPAYGMVPTQALGLDPEMAEDGFGTKFSYIVDRRFTRTSTGSEDAAVISFELIKSLPHEADAIGAGLVGIILTASGTKITPNNNAILVLISHGANKFKGWNASGTTQNIAAGTADENSNGCGSIDDPQTVPCNTTSVASTYDRTFIASSTDANFDDIVLFKTKTQLVRDAGLEFIMCNNLEASTPDTNSVCELVAQTFSTANYGDDSYGDGGICLKTCGKYGIWSGEKIDQPISASLAVFNEGATMVIGATLVTMPFGLEKFDDNDEFSNNTYIVKKKGKYSVTYNLLLDWNNLSANELYVYVVVNDINVRSHIFNSYANGRGGMNNSYVLDLNTDDVVKINAQASFGAFYIPDYSNENWDSFFSVFLIK